MASWRRAVLLGLVVWLVPFVVSFALAPVRASWRSLFESIMPVVVSAVVVACGLRYLRKMARVTIREGLALGILWLTISVLIDLPLMLTPPIRMPVVEYAADVGLTYLMMPIITAGLAAAASCPPSGAPPPPP
jgi:hypothetical protein